ncbi:MAG TPA: ribosome recycling factor [Candidatus Dormibacteraeota bacterium]|nr:ribosome recycling factor [Candidatus Dormibacteraeota bacterium]
MTAAELVSGVDARFKKALEHLEEELKTLRTGRAQTAMVENVTVEQYGQPMLLKAVATISTPDASTIAISPWDRNMVEVIEKALRESKSLSLNPSSDGTTVRINIPSMTEEARREIVKQLGTKVEQCHIALRNIRHEVLNEVRKLEKDKQIGQDESRRAETDLNKKIEQYNQKADDIARQKEQEILTV